MKQTIGETFQSYMLLKCSLQNFSVCYPWSLIPIPLSSSLVLLTLKLQELRLTAEAGKVANIDCLESLLSVGHLGLLLGVPAEHWFFFSSCFRVTKWKFPSALSLLRQTWCLSFSTGPGSFYVEMAQVCQPFFCWNSPAYCSKLLIATRLTFV